MNINNQLVLHCGAYIVSESALASLETPKPAGKHYPTNYHKFFTNTRDALIDRGFTVGDAIHSTSHDDGCYFSIMPAFIPKTSWTSGDVYKHPELGSQTLLTKQTNYMLKTHELWESQDTVSGTLRHIYIPPTPHENEEPVFQHVVGLRSSWNQKFSNQLVMGTRVFVCDNLAFSGEIMLRRKNTQHAQRDLPEMCHRAIDQVSCHQVNEERRTEAYQNSWLGPSRGRATIMNAIEAKVVGGSKALQVLREFENPQHAEHLNASGERTVWTLKNAFTEAFKDFSLNTLPARSRYLNRVLDRVAGFNSIINEQTALSS
tara:strand:+ start:2092 stop:3042 length:951 start_codon:yes stop_codon:yes gene_type:complete